MYVGLKVSKSKVREEERETAAALGMTVDEFRSKYAPWRLANVREVSIRPRLSTSQADHKRRYGAESLERALSRPRKVGKSSPKPTVRKRVFKRDGGRCRYCGADVSADQRGLRMFTVDHVVPRSQGGTNEESNLVTACFQCNHRKGDKTLTEVGMALLPVPSAAVSTCDEGIAQSETIVFVRVYTHSKRHRDKVPA